jgi:hypothetical protein
MRAARRIAKQRWRTISPRCVRSCSRETNAGSWICGDPGTIEAVAGGADAVGIAAKMANSIGQSNALHKAYSPVSIEAVRNTDAARLQGPPQDAWAERKEAKSVNRAVKFTLSIRS